MEIKTEADDVDEGVSPNELRAPTGVSATGAATRWMSPRIRKKLKHAKSFNKTWTMKSFQINSLNFPIYIAVWCHLFL